MPNEQTLKELSLNIVDALKNRSNQMLKDRYYFKTGVKLIDMVLGGEKGVYGDPAGRIINVVGDKSTGKTFICNEFIANAHWIYGDKFKWMYADCERGYSFDTQSLYGMDIWTPESDAPENVEQAFYCINKFAESLKDDEFGIYVLDSLDALTSDEQDKRADERIKTIEAGKEMKGTYGMGKAKYLSQEFFPQLCKVLENKNILLIIVSQIRDNTDMFSFEQYSRSGGKALDFYCYMVFWLATAKKITYKEGENNEVILGGTNLLKVTKGKVPRPYRKCFYTFYFARGIDNVETGVDYLFDIRTKTGDLSTNKDSCAWENDPNKKPMSSTAVAQWLRDNKWYEGKEGTYRAELQKTHPGERYSLQTALEYINSDPEKKELFDKTFSLTMDRETLINYIYDNGLEEELDRRVEEKWEAFEDRASSEVAKRQGKYAKYYANQPDVVES